MKTLIDTAIAVHKELHDASAAWLKSIATAGGNPQYTVALKKNNFIINFAIALDYDKLF